MEFWWWIEPLLITGVLGAVLASLIAAFSDGECKAVVWIVVCLMIPVLAAIAATAAWVILYVLWFIWSPYF